MQKMLYRDWTYIRIPRITDNNKTYEFSKRGIWEKTAHLHDV